MTFRWLTLAVVLAWASAAHAQSPDVDQRARAHFQAATAYYDEGDYEHAVTEFRAAYAASPHAELLYNVYLCEERLGHLAPALEALQQYLASDATIENRAALEARLGHLRERQASGETTVGDAALPERSEATDAPPPSPPPPVDAGPHPLVLAGFTVAAIGLVSFAIFGGLTLSEDARLRGSCGHACSDADTNLVGITGIAADVSAAVALVGAVLGVVGLFLPTGNGDVEVAVGPASLSLRGTF